MQAAVIVVLSGLVESAHQKCELPIKQQKTLQPLTGKRARFCVEKTINTLKAGARGDLWGLVQGH